MNSCISEVSYQPVAIIELRSLPRSLIVNPRGQAHTRQTREMHPAHVPSPSESQASEIVLEGFQLHPTLEAHLSDSMFSDVLHINSAHSSYTVVMKHLQSFQLLFRQTPSFITI